MGASSKEKNVRRPISGPPFPKDARIGQRSNVGTRTQWQRRNMLAKGLSVSLEPTMQTMVGLGDVEAPTKPSTGNGSAYLGLRVSNSDQHDSRASALRNDSGSNCGKAIQSSYEAKANRSVFIREDGQTIYGRLFEVPDPWRRIGIILGLEEDVVQLSDNHDDAQFSLQESIAKGQNNDNTITSMPESSAILEVTDSQLDPMGRESREGSPDVLAVPPLQQVNGKYVGPSIYFEEDELLWKEDGA